MINTLTEEEFEEQRREKLLGFDIYSELAEELVLAIPRSQRNLAEPTWLAAKDEAQRVLASSAGAKYSVDLLALSYSAGANFGDLRALYPAVCDTWLMHEKHHHAYDQSPLGKTSTTATFALQGDDFATVNRMVCFGVLLGFGDLLPSVARIIEYKNPRMDGMPTLHGASGPMPCDRAHESSTRNRCAVNSTRCGAAQVQDYIGQRFRRDPFAAVGFRH